MATPAEIAEAHDQLLLALSFYADPDTYFAIAFFNDPPCGDFMNDFSIHGDPNYPEEDWRPGKRAREALELWGKTLGERRGG